MIGSAVFSLIFSNVIGRISTKLSIDIGNDIQADIFDKIIDADWLEINKYSNGDVLNRFNSDVSTISGNVISWLLSIVIAIYNFIATFVVIWHYDKIMSFLAFASAPVMLLMSKFLIKKQREWQQKFKVISLEYNMFSIKTGAFMSVMGMIVQYAAFGYCLFRLWTHDITYGTMTLFLQQRSSLNSAFNNVVSIIPAFLNSSISAHRIRELAQLPKEVHIPESNELDELAGNGFEVRMRDMNFSYVEGTRVITQSPFKASPGEIVALVGPSGEGKTTMIRLILGLIRPEEGQAQRITIARTVLRDAPILLLDEATSALDVTTERRVLRNIISQRPNKTCIVTTHRPSVLNMCQRVYRVMETIVTELSEEEAGKMAMDF